MSDENSKRNPELNEAEMAGVDGGAMQPGLQIQPVQISQPLNPDGELARTGEADRPQRASDPDKRFY